MRETSDAQHTSLGSGLRRSIAEIRADFPGLIDGEVRLDGAAGTLVPQAVIDAVSDEVLELRVLSRVGGSRPTPST